MYAKWIDPNLPKIAIETSDEYKTILRLEGYDLKEINKAIMLTQITYKPVVEFDYTMIDDPIPPHLNVTRFEMVCDFVYYHNNMIRFLTKLLEDSNLYIKLTLGDGYYTYLKCVEANINSYPHIHLGNGLRVNMIGEQICLTGD